MSRLRLYIFVIYLLLIKWNLIIFGDILCFLLNIMFGWLLVFNSLTTLRIALVFVLHQWGSNRTNNIDGAEPVRVSHNAIYPGYISRMHHATMALLCKQTTDNRTEIAPSIGHTDIIYSSLSLIGWTYIVKELSLQTHIWMNSGVTKMHVIYINYLILVVRQKSLFHISVVLSKY